FSAKEALGGVLPLPEIVVGCGEEVESFSSVDSFLGNVSSESVAHVFPRDVGSFEVHPRFSQGLDASHFSSEVTWTS
ncbi:hypothetical protein A2U01_0090352, partial [Trifolium medium]|nr:hypothetical protein [Trifolium medium]